MNSQKPYDATKREVNWDLSSHKNVKQMTIEYNKINVTIMHF